MKTVMILIDSRNENDIDMVYEYCLDELEFQDCMNGKEFPFTMLVRQSEQSAGEISGFVNRFIEENQLEEMNVCVSELADFYHNPATDCQGI